jgi:hypothetical protein
MEGWAVIQPRRQPGATVLEKVSRRMTRPSVSILRKDGVRLSMNGKEEEVVGWDRGVGWGASWPLDSASAAAAEGN